MKMSYVKEILLCLYCVGMLSVIDLGLYVLHVYLIYIISFSWLITLPVKLVKSHMFSLLLLAFQALKDLYTHLTPIQRVSIARHPNRPTFLDHIFNITEKVY